MQRIEVDICVIGAGPTGLAALFESRRRGHSAVALEAGETVATSICSHIPGVTYRSPADHFEIATLPVDCRGKDQCTREDVLHYYHRVARLGDLNVIVNTRCEVVRQIRNRVVVEARSRERTLHIDCRAVIVTAWHAARVLRCEAERSRLTPPIISVGAAAASGLRTAVVVGGGLSGYEVASSLMLAGTSVTLVTRGAVQPMHGNAEFQMLLRATGSRLEAGASVARRVARGCLIHSGRGDQYVPTEAIVPAIGSQIDRRVIRMLRSGGVIDAALAKEIVSMRSGEQLLRDHSHLPANEFLDLAHRARPDLWRYLFRGSRGVHFAGGVLHHGAHHAGLGVSLATAVLAVRSIDGVRPPRGFEKPLHQTLADMPRVCDAVRSDDDTRLVEAIYPVRVTSWSRRILTPFPVVPPRQSGALPYLIGDPSPDDVAFARIADGATRLGQIANALGLRSKSDRKRLVDHFRHLCHNNGFTWVPAPPAPES